MTNNLVIQTRVDKNGVTTRRWVRPATEPEAGARSLPAPVTPTTSSAVKMTTTDVLMTEILMAIHDGRADSNARTDRSDLRVLARDTNIAELSAIAKVFPKSNNGILAIRNIYQKMVEVGIERPEEAISVEFVDAYIHLRMKVVMNAHHSDAELDDGEDLLKLVFASSEEDRLRLDEIIESRKMFEFEGIRDVLHESKRILPALSEGAL